VLIHVVELAVDRRLALQVLAVQPLDELGIGILALVAGVVAVDSENWPPAA
jgi:hypothetical protein